MGYYSERSEESARCLCSLFVGYKNVTRKVGGDVGVCDANSTGYKRVTRKRVGNGLTVITATLSFYRFVFLSARHLVVFVFLCHAERSEASLGE